MVTAQLARGYAPASVEYRLATVASDSRPTSSFPVRSGA
jgi:hypothetical protein